MTSVSRFAQFARLAFVATLVCVPMHEAQAQLAIDKLDLVLRPMAPKSVPACSRSATKVRRPLRP